MRIALSLSLAALLFATPVLAAAAPAPTTRDDQAQTGHRTQTHRTQTGPSRARPASRTSQIARPTPAAKPTPAQPQASRQARAAAPAQPAATRQNSARLPRVIHGVHARNHARGVEASHPGLGEPETDSATPQVVHFPGTIATALPTVLSGGPLEGSPGGNSGGLSGGYCGQMLMPAVALREISRGFRAGHAGIDLMAAHGSPIRAAASGSVIYAGWYFAYGNIVDIRHTDGVVTRYAHMSAFGPGIGAGAEVRAGDVIGNVGATGRATGPHIHFEVRLNGRAVDPRPYLALASCDGTSPREEILEAYADERPRATQRRPAARSRQAARPQAQPVHR